MMYIDTSEPFPLEQLKNMCDISEDLMLKALNVSKKTNTANKNQGDEKNNVKE